MVMKMSDETKSIFFPCAIGTIVYFPSERGIIEVDEVTGFKGIDKVRYVLLKRNEMITIGAFKRYGFTNIEGAKQWLRDRGLLYS